MQIEIIMLMTLVNRSIIERCSYRHSPPMETIVHDRVTPVLLSSHERCSDHQTLVPSRSSPRPSFSIFSLCCNSDARNTSMAIEMVHKLYGLLSAEPTNLWIASSDLILIICRFTFRRRQGCYHEDRNCRVK